MTAVAALPDLDLGPLEDFCSLDILQERAVTLFVTLLDGGNHSELDCELSEAFLFCCLGEAFVHVGPFVVLTRSCIGEILRCVIDSVQFLEPKLCVFFLVLCCLKEQSCDLLEAFLLCAGSEIGVLVTGLRLTGKSRFQILFCLGS